MTKKEIHISDVRTFKQCRYLWDLSSQLRMNLEPERPPVYFFLGDGIHTALEYYYGHDLPLVDTFTEWFNWRFNNIKQAAIEAYGDFSLDRETELLEQKELGLGMLGHYMMTYPRSEEPFEVIATEQNFKIPIRTPRGFKSRNLAAGRFDGIIFYPQDGTYWILEHKSAASFQGLDRLDMDSQATMYVAAALELGFKVEGIYFNFLRKKVPAKPKELARGGLSVNKNIDTTFQVYLAEIQRLGLDPFTYVPILTRLKDKGNSFFERIRVRRSAQEIKTFWSNLYEVARDMTDPRLRVYPSDHFWNCNSCRFREPCLMRHAGQPYKDLLEVGYRPRSEREIFIPESLRETTS